MPAVDRFYRCVLVGIACQHHAHRIGRLGFDLGEKFNPVHAGHLHIRYDNGIRPLILNDGQGLFTAQRDVQRKFMVQFALESTQDVGLVVHE